jgi:hypothetical protein
MNGTKNGKFPMSPSMFGVQPILWTLLKKNKNKIAIDCFG